MAIEFLFTTNNASTCKKNNDENRMSKFVEKTSLDWAAQEAVPER